MAEFRLYDGDTTSLLGSYRSAEDAYAAADDHTLAILAAAGGWVVVEHLLARVDADGEIHLSAEVTHVGPAEDLEGCREWLRQLPGRSAAHPI